MTRLKLEPGYYPTAQLAKMLGVDKATVTAMTREEGAPYFANEGGWLLPNALHWYIRREKKRGRPAAPQDLNQAKLRREVAAAELAELELATQRGELMTVAQYEAALTEALYRVAARLDNFAMRAAPLVVGLKSKAEALRIIEGLVDEARAELSEGAELVEPDEEAA